MRKQPATAAVGVSSCTDRLAVSEQLRSMAKLLPTFGERLRGTNYNEGSLAGVLS